MGYTTSLLDGLAALIAEAGLAVYRPDGAYTAGETGLLFTVMPDTPERVIVLTPYPVEDTDLTDAITGIQARMRCGRDPREVEDLADGLFSLLHNRRGLVLGGVQVALVWRQSQAPMGQDVHGRQEIAANYYARTTRPAPHLYE
ncbi:minor capsid protein [Streptomyces phaeochromogenes]|uniref:minor capsid protein n=1 Tax=Streptomyces phaeochromogenes TaxID=1923 RepID=UPI003862D89B|nr:minor capsid protein [Streptomyces phaeochromogenes]